ncbi:MAG TPA: hypothetical protein PLI21_02260 [Methanomassiliicoccaceae archaeon]|jgi:hypothetical protein|nr:hypothetical protein [Methanomassiliicoccaceae archaeon]
MEWLHSFLYRNSMKATFSVNTASNGTMARLSAFCVLGEFSLEEEMSSLDDSNNTSATATNAPPTPRPITEVKVMADDAAVVAVVTAIALDSMIDENEYQV